MKFFPTTLSSLLAVAGGVAAQSPELLLTYSEPELTVFGSGGASLGMLQPNEIQQLRFPIPCPALSAEKWMPVTCANVMAGDENADGDYWRGNLFGRVDALVSTRSWVSAAGVDNQRTIYFSPSVPMGTTVSGGPGLRPGDLGRIRRLGGADGQVQHFVMQEQLNLALGLLPSYPLDVDAASFQPNVGLLFSVDVDVAAITVCGPTLVRDGDVICLPGGTLTYTPDLRIAATTPNSAVIAYTEAEMDAFTANASVTDRFGNCVVDVLDVESLDIDMAGPVTTITPCPGVTVTVPNLRYSCEKGTGASLLQTAGGGSIATTPCGLAGTPCAVGGPTWGTQMGVRPASSTVGAASYVNALASARACLHVLEPQQHVVVSPSPPVQVDYNNPFVLSLVLIELAPPFVPPSATVFPYSMTCFPSLYAPSITPHTAVGPGFGSFATPAFPAAFFGKVLFQGVGFSSGTFEFSTPAVLDVF